MGAASDDVDDDDDFIFEKVSEGDGEKRRVENEGETGLIKCPSLPPLGRQCLFCQPPPSSRDLKESLTFFSSANKVVNNVAIQRDCFSGRSRGHGERKRERDSGFFSTSNLTFFSRRRGKGRKNENKSILFSLFLFVKGGRS